MLAGRHSIGAAGFSASSAFDPVSLFGGSDDGWYREASLATTFTDSARTIPTTVGNPVGGVTDLSGKGNHGTTDTDAERATLRQAANGNYYYEFDTTDRLAVGLNLISRRMTIAMAFRPLAQDFLFLRDRTNASIWAGIGQSGSTTTLTANLNTLNSTYYDNVLLTDLTRGGSYTAAQSAKSVVIDFTAGGLNWRYPIIGRQVTSGLLSVGDVFADLAIDRELTSTERADLTTYFMSLVP
jgi:hypothetical protein